MLHVNSIAWCQLVLTVPSQISHAIPSLANWTNPCIDSPWGGADTVEGVQHSTEVVCLLQEKVVLVGIGMAAHNGGCKIEWMLVGIGMNISCPIIDGTP